mmetsp:Transcript_8440/g.31235  ORF Transcript_8440/g.31235 Transcript_8440/m.31235 type:complete len:237 (+) Transcript_8440:511-1221(+)
MPQERSNSGPQQAEMYSRSFKKMWIRTGNRNFWWDQMIIPFIFIGTRLCNMKSTRRSVSLDCVIWVAPGMDTHWEMEQLVSTTERNVSGDQNQRMPFRQFIPTTLTQMVCQKLLLDTKMELWRHAKGIMEIPYSRTNSISPLVLFYRQTTRWMRKRNSLCVPTMERCAATSQWRFAHTRSNKVKCRGPMRPPFRPSPITNRLSNMNCKITNKTSKRLNRARSTRVSLNQTPQWIAN